MNQLQKEKRQVALSPRLIRWAKRQRRRSERHHLNRAMRDDSKPLGPSPMPYLF